MRYYAWINCGESKPSKATPCVEESEFPPHGFRHATRRGEGATEGEAIARLALDVADWDALHKQDEEINQ